MEIIRASTSADLLALVPSLVGFVPERSLVCVPFTGTRTLPAALRVDLPVRRREADVRALVNAVLGLLSRFRGVDGVALVVYSDLTFVEERGVPYLDVARAAARGFERAGFRVVESACVAPDGWQLYDGVHHPAGRSLSEIASDREVGAATPPLPVVSAEMRAEVARLVGAGEVGEDVDLLGLLEESLLELTAERAALLLEVIARPPMRDVALLQWAYGWEVGLRAYDDNMMWLALQERTGESMDELVARELAEGGEVGIGGLGADDADLLIGRTGRIPDRERLERAVEVAGRLVGLAPPAILAPALTVLGWLYWALGRGTAAGAAFDQALEADAGYGLAHLMHTVAGAGMVPDWLFTVASPPQGVSA